MKPESVPYLPFALSEIGHAEIGEAADALGSHAAAFNFCANKTMTHDEGGTGYAKLT